MIDAGLAPFRDASDARAYEATPIAARLQGADLPELLARVARARPDAVAIRFLADAQAVPRDTTFAELDRQVIAFAAALRRRGVQEDDGVVLLAPNLPQTAAACLGAMRVARAVPVNHYLPAAELAQLVRGAGGKVLVTSTAQPGVLDADKLRALLALCPGLQVVLLEGEPVDGALAFDAFCAQATAQDLRACRTPAPADRTCAVFHTGGTTGLPKFVPLTPSRFATAAVFSAFGYGYRPADTVLCAMPLFHVGGLLACTLFPLCAGARVLMLHPLGYRGPQVLDTTWAVCARERVSVVVGPPTAVGRLAQLDAPTQTALRIIVNGAAALPGAAADRLRERFGVMVTEPWGLTEATLAVTSQPRDGVRRAGSVGLALPYCEVKAVRTDADGRELGDCPAGEAGVLAIRGPSVFAGYLGAVRQPWFAGGWLDTGDLGWVDGEGFVHVTGRAKDVIKRGGHGIDPAVIEEALYRHPAVAHAAAIGRPDAHAGEVPVVYVQLKPGAEAHEDELLQFAAGHIAERAAVPRRSTGCLRCRSRPWARSTSRRCGWTPRAGRSSRRWRRPASMRA
ncbi:MAG TPA: AMP-binding protein [Ramlibacter sp.]|nr:AMP-binding protein [Ramlibacter sp.]